MPRVHQMRTDLAQYYHSTDASVRLSYITTADEKVNFEMNGTELLMRDLNIFQAPMQIIELFLNNLNKWLYKIILLVLVSMI